MRIDIDKLSEEKLIYLKSQDRGAAAISKSNARALANARFQIGDRVSFQPERRTPLVGMLKKTVTVITDSGQHWNVSPSLLRKAESTDRTHSSNVKVVPLRKE